MNGRTITKWTWKTKGTFGVCKPQIKTPIAVHPGGRVRAQRADWSELPLRPLLFPVNPTGRYFWRRVETSFENITDGLGGGLNAKCAQITSW